MQIVKDDAGFNPSLGRRPSNLSPYLLGSLYYGLYWGVYGVFEPFFNIYLQRLGITGFQIGVINSLVPLMALIFSPFISSLADRNAWRSRLLVICLLGLAVACFILGIPKAFLGVFVCSVFIAMLRSPTGPLGDSLVLRLGTRYNIDYGKMRLWGSFTYAIAAFLFGFLFERIGLAWMFPISAVGFFLVTVSAFFMEEGDPVVKKNQSPWKLILRNKILLALLLAAVFFGAATNIFLFSSMYIVHLGGGELMAGLLLGATALLEVPAMHFGGGLMRRFGGMRTLLFGFGFFAAAFLVGIVAWAPWVLLIAGMLEGGGFGLSFVAIVVIFDQHAPDNWSASIQALVNAGMFGVAPFLSAIAYGAIYDGWPVGVYVFSLGLITCAILALLIAIRMENRDTAMDKSSG